MALQGAYARNKARRTKNVNAHIDESLFASKNSSRGSRRGPKGAAVVSNDYLKSMRDDAPGAKNSVVVTGRELDDIHRSTIILTAADRARMKQDAEASQNERAAKAKARKARMRAIEEDKKRRAPVLTESERLKYETDKALLANAKEQMDEELDDVKHMNQMILYAKCATIRDMQIREKARLQEEKMKEEERLDKEMEVKRIQDIKMFEERERVRRQEQKLGAQHVIYQIQEREQERMRQQELREQEAKAMLEKISIMEEQDEQKRLAKIEQGKKLFATVLKANKEATNAKMRIKQQEMEEEMRIAQYVAERDAKMAAREEEERAIKHAKDMEIARLRAQQQKILDTRGAEDELRAKRYQEAYDREWRKKLMNEARKKEASYREMAEAREIQRRDKANRIAEQAVRERQEFEQNLRFVQEQTVLDAEKVKVEKVKAKEHREDLLNQIAEHNEEREMARKKFLEEGRNISVQMAIDRRKLLRLKAQKMQELSEAGVPSKYQADLAKKKVLVMALH